MAKKPSGTGTDVTRSHRVLAAVSWTIALAAALGLWTFGSPVGSSPDEPAHMTTAWGLVTGQNVFDPPCDGIEPECNVRRIEVPAGLIPSVTCHQFRPDVPASCVQPDEGATALTNALRYPPLFYAVVGTSMRVADGLGLGPEGTGYVGRLSGALAALSLVLPALVLASRRAPNVAYTIIAALTPMTMFLAGTINPNGVEIAGAIAAATALVLASREGSFQHGAGALLVWGTLWLAWVRPLSPLWAAAVIGFGALYLEPRALRDRNSLRSLVSHRALWAATGVVLTSMVWFIYSLGARNTGASRGLSMPEETSEQLIATALRWGGMLRESIGILGWLDTRLPHLLILGLVALIAALLTLFSAAEGDRLQRRVVVAFGSAMVIGITVLMFRQQFLWQGRYVVPVAVAGAIWWSGTVRTHTVAFAQRLASMIWVLMTAGALFVASRYSYGLERGSRFEIPNLSGDAQWFGPLGPTGLVILAVAAFVGGLLAIWAVGRLHSDTKFVLSDPSEPVVIDRGSGPLVTAAANASPASGEEATDTTTEAT